MLLKCENVCLSYENKKVMENLSFEVNSGDFLYIVGENGSGKSTLVKAILGLKKTDSGKISFGDGLTKTEIGYLPQQTQIQKDFPASVWEVVISGCQGSRGIRPFYNKAEKKRARENIKKLGIESIVNKKYRDLSGGQQQRVLLARALCATKKLILMDEPTAGLDPLITQEFYRLIQNLREDGITVITVSHDIPMAIRTATKILHISQTPIFFGPVSDYLKSDAGKLFTYGINSNEIVCPGCGSHVHRAKNSNSLIADNTVEEGAIADSTVEDSTIANSAIEDSTIANSAIADNTVADNPVEEGGEDR